MLFGGLINTAKTRASGSGYGSGVDISIAPDLYETEVNVFRHGTTYNFDLNVPYNYFCTWAIVEAKTQIAVNVGSGLAASFTANFTQEAVSGYSSLEQGVKFYDIIVTAIKNGVSYLRHFRRAIVVYPALFTEAAADLVWNFSSGGMGYKDGGGTDRIGYQIFIKGTYSGASYLGIEDYRSSDPTQPVHILVDPANLVTISSTNAWCLRINKDCQNLIFDACGDRSLRQYGLKCTISDAGGSQCIMIQPADTASGSTTSSAGKNITIGGIEVDNGRNGGSGFNVNFDTAGNATINYDNWSFDRLNVFNMYIHDTTDEGFYIGRFNDALVSGYAKPKVTNMVFCHNIVEESGGDGYQFGIVFNSEIHNNTGIRLNWRNATDHRNLIQLVACSDTYVYRNNLSWNSTEGGSTLWNLSSGRGGGDIWFWSNLLNNQFTGSHINGFINIEENEYSSPSFEMNIYNNTILLNIENSIEVWNKTSSPVVTTYINPLRIVDNAIFNDNDPDEIAYFNSPNQTYFTISNLFNQTSSSFGFTDFAGGNFRPLNLSAALFGSTTSFTKTHPCANQDLEGYEFKTSIRGCYSGVTLQMSDGSTTTTSTSTSTTTSTTSTTTSTSTSTTTTTTTTTPGSVNLKVNIYTGTASGWVATGSTPPTSGTTVDYGQMGTSGIGLRANSNGTTHRWNTAGSSGPTTGANTGVFPDAVMTTYWYCSNSDIGRFELYNHTGTPLSTGTFQIKIHGGRGSIAGPRTTQYRVNGGSWQSLNTAANTANVVTFSGVSAISGVITVECQSTTPTDSAFGYINGFTIISE